MSEVGDERRMYVLWIVSGTFATQAVDLQQWWHPYQVVVRRGVKLYFTDVGQAQCGRGRQVSYLMKVRTHGYFIVLFHWDTRSPASWHDILLSHNIVTLSQTVLPLSS